MIQTGHEAAAIQLAEGKNTENRDGKAADDEADTVDGIRVGNGFQAAEDGIDRADHADSNT